MRDVAPAIPPAMKYDDTCGSTKLSTERFELPAEPDTDADVEIVFNASLCDLTSPTRLCSPEEEDGDELAVAIEEIMGKVRGGSKGIMILEVHATGFALGDVESKKQHRKTISAVRRGRGSEVAESRHIAVIPTVTVIVSILGTTPIAMSAAAKYSGLPDIVSCVSK